MFSTILQNLL